jgi:hypothetical protein
VGRAEVDVVLSWQSDWLALCHCSGVGLKLEADEGGGLGAFLGCWLGVGLFAAAIERGGV